MSKLRLNIATSLDGFVAGPDRSRGGAASRPKFEQLRVIAAPGLIHIRYAVTQ